MIRARLEKLLDRLPALVYRCRIMDKFSFVLEYASKGSMDLLGVSPEELRNSGVNIIERMTHPRRLQSICARWNMTVLSRASPGRSFTA